MDEDNGCTIVNDSGLMFGVWCFKTYLYNGYTHDWFSNITYVNYGGGLNAHTTS